MIKVAGSSVKIDAYSKFNEIEFNDIVDDLLQVAKVKELDNYAQHLNTSRLQHSINVAYYSYLVCKVLHFDYKSAARAGILHDFFLYDWRTEKQTAGLHAFSHPRAALENSREYFELNEIEEDAIVKHMWPLNVEMPKYKESYVVSFADKYCATIEVIASFKRKIGDKFAKKALV